MACVETLRLDTTGFKSGCIDELFSGILPFEYDELERKDVKFLKNVHIVTLPSITCLKRKPMQCYSNSVSGLLDFVKL